MYSHTQFCFCCCFMTSDKMLGTVMYIHVYMYVIVIRYKSCCSIPVPKKKNVCNYNHNRKFAQLVL